MFARALRAATSENQLSATKKGKGGGKTMPPRASRSPALTRAGGASDPGEVGRGNLRHRQSAFDRRAWVVGWLATHQQDYLSEFQKIAEIDTLGRIVETPGA